MALCDRARVLNLDQPPFAGRSWYLHKADRSVIQTTHCGILFVMAFWSATSFRSFAHLKQVLSTCDPDGRLEVVVVDADGCPDLYHAPEFLGKLHGNGEAAWINAGRVISTGSIGSDPKAFETFTRHLLQACAAC
jgi:hypothetical protein